MQATSDSALDFANENTSGRNTPGNSANAVSRDFEQQLLAATRIQQSSAQQQHTVDPFANFLSELDQTPSLAPPSDLDWLLSAPADPLAAAAVPAPDISQFDRDLEQALASFEPSQLNYINNLNALDFTQQQFLFHRGAPTSLSHPGPLSAITASSESAYDDGRSESQYNPYSPQGSLVNATVPSHYNPALYQALDHFAAELAVFGLTEPVTGLEGVVPSQTNTRHLLNNPIQPPSVNIESLMPSSTASGHSFSSFDESGVSSMDRPSPDDAPLSDDAAELEREFGKSTNLINAANYPTVPPQSSTDPRKKYQCPNCPRAFARAFNLKTHMATHDPNRLKPHLCHHTGCGRSFSRKHDLGRHLVSIHKDESGLKMTNVGSSSASTYGISGHPLPHVNAHANAGRLHTVGSTDTKSSSHQKGSTTPTATSANFLPNIALGSQSGNSNNYSQSLGSSFIKTEPKPLTIPGLNHLRKGSGNGVST